MNLITAISLALSVATGTSHSSPPASAQELAKRFAAAINAHSPAAVDALVYWGTADAHSRELTEALLGMYEVETIASTHLAPLDASAHTTYHDPNGHVYGPSLTPAYTLVLKYKHGPEYKVDEGSLTIGSKDGAWYVIAVARLR